MKEDAYKLVIVILHTQCLSHDICSVYLTSIHRNFLYKNKRSLIAKLTYFVEWLLCGVELWTCSNKLTIVVLIHYAYVRCIMIRFVCLNKCLLVVHAPMAYSEGCQVGNSEMGVSDSY